jgi:hypothetical protein
MKRGTLIIFLKSAQAGRVKSRLARQVGAGRAVSIYRFLTALTLHEAVKSGARILLAVDPPAAARGRRRDWPAGLARIAQVPGDLGARLRAAVDAAPAGPVVVIGSDAPLLRAGHIRAAFAALGRADAVFGPAADGGFWLVGLARRRAAPDLFAGVRWSSRAALEGALASLPKDFKVARLAVLRDIDEAKDLAAQGPLTRSRRACA